jgi:hypothetical protein
MGRVDAVISDDLEKKLRMKAVEKFGGKKGSLTNALEDAIQTWLNEDQKQGKKQ